MNKEKTTKRIGVAVLWSFAAELAAKILVPITNMILARILVPEAFGIIATISMIVSFADMLSVSGISKYIVQHEFKNEEELLENANVAFWTNTIISVSSWIIIVIFSKQLSKFVGNAGYEIPLIVSALSLPLTAFSSVQEAFFQRSLKYKELFYRRLAVSLLPFLVTIPLALLGCGYWALIIGTLSSNILKIIMLSLSSPWKPQIYFSIKKLKTMFSFCVWMLLGAISSWAVYYIDIFVVSNKMNLYYTGLYKNSQTTVTGILSIITAATTSVLFASLSREQNNGENFNKLLFAFQRKVGMFVLPIGVGIFCFSDLITYLLLGKQWMEASSFIGMWGLSVATICVFADFCKEACKAKGKPKIPFYVQVLHLFFLIPVCYFGVGKGFKILGLMRALANLELILLYFVFCWYTIKISPVKIFISLKGPIISSLIMGIFAKILLNVFSNNYFVQFIYIGICMIIYFSILSLFKSYRLELKESVKIIKEKFGRKGNKKDV